MEPCFTQLGIGHLSFLVALDSRCFENEWGALKHREELECKNSFVLGAFLGDELVGALTLRLMFDELWIFRIMTEPSLRREGIASRMLQKAFLRYEKPLKVFLEVSVDNLAAIKFYEKEGFKSIYIRKDYYVGARGESSDAIVMQRNINHET